jgi:WD40 repeat protein
MFDSFQAHQKFIGGLILTHNNNRIMTSSKDCILKVWDHREDKKKVQEEASKKIISLFGLKNGKILASRDKDILIYELNEKKKYFNSQSLSSHKELVFALGELEDGTIISGGKDKKIILWEEAPDRKQYQVKQEILTNKEIQMLTVLSDFKIAFSGFNDSCINILGTKTVLEKKEKKIEEKIESTSYEQICELNKHRGIVTCLCKLNFGYMASGGGDSKKYIDHNIYIWKPTNTGFDIGQVINDAHLANVNCLILLRDGRMASSSTDRTIKIWGINKF